MNERKKCAGDAGTNELTKEELERLQQIVIESILHSRNRK
jgi:hypothetical protein